MNNPDIINILERFGKDELHIKTTGTWWQVSFQEDAEFWEGSGPTLEAAIEDAGKNIKKAIAAGWPKPRSAQT